MSGLPSSLLPVPESREDVLSTFLPETLLFSPHRISPSEICPSEVRISLPFLRFRICFQLRNQIISHLFVFQVHFVFLLQYYLYLWNYPLANFRALKHYIAVVVHLQVLFGDFFFLFFLAKFIINAYCFSDFCKNTSGRIINFVPNTDNVLIETN